MSSGPNWTRPKVTSNPVGVRFGAEPGCFQRTVGDGDRLCPHQPGTASGVSANAGTDRRETAEAFMGENQPDQDAFGETARKKLGTIAIEELEQVIDGLNEIVGA